MTNGIWRKSQLSIVLEDETAKGGKRTLRYSDVVDDITSEQAKQVGSAISTLTGLKIHTIEVIETRDVSVEKNA